MSPAIASRSTPAKVAELLGALVDRLQPVVSGRAPKPAADVILSHVALEKRASSPLKELACTARVDRLEQIAADLRIGDRAERRRAAPLRRASGRSLTRHSSDPELAALSRLHDPACLIASLGIYLDAPS